MVENGVSYPKPVTLAEALIEGDIQQKNPLPIMDGTTIKN